MAQLLGETVLEVSAQGPAPIKDYYSFRVTQTEVIWRWWKISLRLDSRSMRPGEVRESHSEYLEDSRLQGVDGVWSSCAAALDVFVSGTVRLSPASAGSVTPPHHGIFRVGGCEAARTHLPQVQTGEAGKPFYPRGVQRCRPEL
ncbi:F-box only protein 36b isoform X5 [Silurus meridionalis]|uniref:F-box only protein 36b isoform X5 n=1 Tax=Silurus meridionalis TaxID=175797 RepID=UPI001EEB0858|nr:F-box only protein 36b isoform X5 [Silurus meridionalis]